MNYKKYYRDKEYRENESQFANIFEKRILLIKKYIKSKGRVLDVGCSNGVFLDLFKKRNWQTWGVDPSENAEIARIKGHRISNDSFENVSLQKNYFDLVILNHTLEHMDNPRAIIKKAYTLLKNGGILFIDVPNKGSLLSKLLGNKWPYLLPDEHKSQFTKKSLYKMVSYAGFKVEKISSRSGIFEYRYPLKEIVSALMGAKKRFFTDIIYFPFSLLVGIINMGDSMSIIAKKK